MVHSTSETTSLCDLLDACAERQPGAPAFVFRSEAGDETTLSYGDLQAQALALSAYLIDRSEVGDRALLVFPTGQDFIVAYFACLYAGLIPAAIAPPRRLARRDHSLAIAEDCGAKLLLTNEDSASRWRPDLHLSYAAMGVEVLAVDKVRAEGSVGRRRPGSNIAFLQYTSGSTGTPKGVIVNSENAIANLSTICTAFGLRTDSVIVGWQPLYHDMGLLTNMLVPVFIGTYAVLISPNTFLKRPMSWLKAIHDHRADLAGGPNFAYDHCVDRLRREAIGDIDLSCWKVAYNGAEPVRASSMDRFAAAFEPFGFSAKALYPCYGLAEATLMVSGADRGAGYRTDPEGAVSCGPPAPGVQIAIVDLDTLRRQAPGGVGEVWVCGAGVASGYWNREAESVEVFGGRLSDDPVRAWLRTGDEGRLDSSGQLFITGRLKDLIIVRGVNHHPHDIEFTAQSAHPALTRGRGAAFAWRDAMGVEKLVIVQEIDRHHRRDVNPEAVRGDLREAIMNEHELALHELVLIGPGQLPLTTSGKIRRNEARRLWQEGAFLESVNHSGEYSP